MPKHADRVIRAMTDDGAFRVLVARATDTVRAVCEAQRVAGAAAAGLGEIVLAATLVRETMSPGYRVQVLLSDGRGEQLVGDAHGSGRTRGLARVTDPVLGLRPGPGAELRVERMMHAGRSHRGIVETDLEEGTAAALQEYFRQSEQITTMVALACLQDGEEITAAGGFVVQLLPEVTEPPLASMTARVRELGSIDELLVATDADPEHLLHRLLDGCEHTRLAESALAFGCLCDRTRALGAVAVLETVDLEDMIRVGETPKIHCDYCRAKYEIGIDELRRILDDRSE